MIEHYIITFINKLVFILLPKNSMPKKSWNMTCLRNVGLCSSVRSLKYYYLKIKKKKFVILIRISIGEKLERKIPV